MELTVNCLKDTLWISANCEQLFFIKDLESETIKDFAVKIGQVFF